MGVKGLKLGWEFNSDDRMAKYANVKIERILAVVERRIR